MTTNSWPAAGNNGLTTAEWIRMFDSPDGIVEDYTGNSMSLSIVSSTNTVTVGTGIVRIQGYYLEVTAAESFTVPTTAATYTVAVCYDPTLNVADGSGNASTLGPCRLVFFAGAQDTTGGKVYYVLYQGVRAAAQALSGVVWADYRTWSGASVEWPYTQASPPFGVNAAGSFPRGSIRYDAANDRALVRTMVAGSLVWKEIGATDFTPFPLASSIVANGSAPQYYVSPGRMVQLVGDVKRSSGTLGTGSQVTVGTMPAGFRPGAVRGYVCKSFGNPNGTARVEVTPTGAVNLLSGASQETITVLNIDGISYRSEN